MGCSAGAIAPTAVHGVPAPMCEVPFGAVPLCPCSGSLPEPETAHGASGARCAWAGTTVGCQDAAGIFPALQ